MRKEVGGEKERYELRSTKYDERVEDPTASPCAKLIGLESDGQGLYNPLLVGR